MLRLFLRAKQLTLVVTRLAKTGRLAMNEPALWSLDSEALGGRTRALEVLMWENPSPTDTEYVGDRHNVRFRRAENNFNVVFLKVPAAQLDV